MVELELWRLDDCPQLTGAAVSLCGESVAVVRNGVEGAEPLIESTGGGQTKTQAYYSHSLAVQLVENFGQLKVAHAETGKTIPKAYVKVYAQLPNGQVRFYKDGYTDLRGRFDYASLNTNEIEQVQKFSILVLTEDAGALVREAMPPKR